ncbi:hypothetical protein A9Q86_11885 [Flavobacteriales bacterium 33_180_T64]|nr:hypothetical protein A9Q86_11885 [Flavobacteriales bacterium 33_180_T64]
MSKVPTEITDAIRSNSKISDEKLRALSVFSRVVTSKRGLPSETDIANFLEVGYTKTHTLSVVAGVGIKQ